MAAILAHMSHLPQLSAHPYTSDSLILGLHLLPDAGLLAASHLQVPPPDLTPGVGAKSMARS